MKKEGGKRKLIIIIIIIIVIILALAIAGFFILKQSDFNFGFAGFDFSSGLNSIGKSGNAFENAKLNPFSNTTK